MPEVMQVLNFHEYAKLTDEHFVGWDVEGLVGAVDEGPRGRG